MNLHEDAKMKIERKEEQELDSFLIVYFISEVDDRFGAAIEMPEHVEYMTVQDVLDQLNGRK